MSEKPTTEELAVQLADIADDIYTTKPDKQILLQAAARLRELEEFVEFVQRFGDYKKSFAVHKAAREGKG